MATITNYITASFNLNHINQVHIATDNPTLGKLVVQLSEATPPQQLIIGGNDYINLGQWNDTSLSAYLSGFYGVPVSGSI